jgi:hypothetical protein
LTNSIKCMLLVSCLFTIIVFSSKTIWLLKNSGKFRIRSFGIGWARTW